MKAVIKTDTHALLKRLGIDHAECLRAMRVGRIVVDTARGAWIVAVDCASEACADHMPALREAFARAADQAGAVVFRPVYTGGIALARFIDVHWQDLCLELDAPVRAFLDPCRCSIDNGVLRIEVNGALAADKLKVRGCATVLAEYVKKATALDVTVQFVAADFSAHVDETLKQRREEATAHAAARNEVAVAAAAEERKRVVFDSGKANVREAGGIKDICARQALNASVTFEGKAIKVSSAQHEKSCDRFTVTDFASALECVIWGRMDSEGKKPIDLAVGTWVRVSGTLGKSQKGELEVRAERVERIPGKVRLESSDVHRIELHAHTKMSQSDGVADPVELVQRAALWKHPAIGITDHGNVHVFPEAYSAAKNAGIRLLLGMEGYLANHTSEEVKAVASRREQGGRALSRDDVAEFKRGIHHVILYARNRDGLRNLYRLVSQSHIAYFYNKPLLPRDVLLAHRDGLVIGSACEGGEIYRLVLAEFLGKIGKAEFTKQFADAAALYDYFEIQPVANNAFFIARGILKSEDDLRAINRRIFDLGTELGKPVVATGDVHVLDPHDMVVRRVLQVGQGYDKESDESGDIPLYLRTTEEMIEEFKYLGPDEARAAVVDNPARVAAMIEDVAPIPKGFYPPTLDGAVDELNNLCHTRCRELYGPTPHVTAQTRMDRELKDIVSNRFADLYMLAQKVVKKSLDDGYIVGSRGSVGSSFVAFLSGITEVNSLPPHYVCPKCFATEFVHYDQAGNRREKPLDGIEAEVGVDLPPRTCAACNVAMNRYGFDIPFETFVGFKGDKTPDIDLNFASGYQANAHRFVEELFGRDHVYRAGTIATIKSNTAFGFVKKYCESANEQWSAAHMDMVIEGLCGIKRTTGQHPGGLIILPRDKDITEFCPVHYPANKSDSPQTTHFDYHAMEEQLLKLDILSHEDPTQIKMLTEYVGKDITQVPLDDPATLDLFSGLKSLKVTEKDIGSRVGTYGIPEFGTEFVRGMLEETKPKTFADLIRISGLSHGTDVWLNNARDIIRAGKASLKQAICTRDDIMHDLSARGIDPFAAFKIMERVRKGKGLDPAEVELMRAHKIPEWYIESCIKIKYMFPKAHAVAYVINAMRIAYCKVHHPAAFYASYFAIMREALDTQVIAKGKAAVKAAIATLMEGGRKKLTPTEDNQLVVLELAAEMIARGVAMTPINVHKSHDTACIVEGNTIIPPLTAFPGLGANVAKSIVEARQERLFSDREDMRVRTRLNQSVIDAMVHAGVLEGMAESAQVEFDMGMDTKPSVSKPKATDDEATKPAVKKTAAKKGKKQDAPPEPDHASLF